MGLSLQDKHMIVVKVNKIAQDALSAVIADPCGVTVNEMNELRKEGRKVGIYMRVIRNTLLRRAVEGTTLKCLKDMFVGPTLIACSIEHPGTAARLFSRFMKKNDKFKIKAAAFEGKLILAPHIERLANLPSYEEAIIQLIATIKEASIGKLIRTLCAVRDKKYYIK